MRLEDCRVGMEVIFGRGNGEQTRGIIVKINRAKAKVQTTENRGSKSQAGAVWSVPYSLMTPANGEVNIENSVKVENSTDIVSPASVPIPYSPFQDKVEQSILEAINVVYNCLSPENLSCDGEIPMSLINQKRSKLSRQLRGLFQALGREVDEITAWNWEKARQEYHQNRTGTNG